MFGWELRHFDWTITYELGTLVNYNLKPWTLTLFFRYTYGKKSYWKNCGQLWEAWHMMVIEESRPLSHQLRRCLGVGMGRAGTTSMEETYSNKFSIFLHNSLIFEKTTNFNIFTKNMISGVEACQGRLLRFHPKLSDGLFFSLSWEQRGVENEWYYSP